MLRYLVDISTFLWFSIEFENNKNCHFLIKRSNFFINIFEFRQIYAVFQNCREENLSFVHSELVHDDLVQKALLLRRRRPRLNLFDELLHLCADWSVVEFLLQIVHTSAFSAPVTWPVVANAVAGDLLRVAFRSHSIQLVRFSHFDANDSRFGAQSGVARSTDVFCDEAVQEHEFNLKAMIVRHESSWLRTWL